MVQNIDGLYLAPLGDYEMTPAIDAFQRLIATARVDRKIDASWLALAPDYLQWPPPRLVEMKADLVSIDDLLAALSAMAMRRPATLAETLAVLAATPRLLERSFPFLSLGSIKRSGGGVTIPWIESDGECISIEVLEQDDKLWGHYLLFGIP